MHRAITGSNSSVFPVPIEDLQAQRIPWHLRRSKRRRYGRLARYLLGTTGDLVENFHVHLIKRIPAGESAALTIAPDDGVCAIDTLLDRNLICGTWVRVVAPRDGVMSVEAVPIQSGSALATLEVYGGGTGARGNPTVLRVTAGTEYTVDVAVPWGISASQSFVVKTSM